MNHEKGLYFHDRDSLANDINNVPAYYDLSAELIADEIFNNKENTLQVSAADADVIAEHLRQIAESVDREEWDVLDNSDADYQVIVSGSLERGTTYRSYQPVANGISEQKIAAFIAAFNPKVALALLDKNLQLQREKDAIEAVALALRDDMRHAREQLEEAEKQVEEFTMWIKRLAHSLRNAKPNSKLHSAAMDYLSHKGLISVEDVLR